MGEPVAAVACGDAISRAASDSPKRHGVARGVLPDELLLERPAWLDGVVVRRVRRKVDEEFFLPWSIHQRFTHCQRLDKLKLMSGIRNTATIVTGIWLIVNGVLFGCKRAPLQGSTGRVGVDAGTSTDAVHDVGEDGGIDLCLCPSGTATLTVPPSLPGKVQQVSADLCSVNYMSGYPLITLESSGAVKCTVRVTLNDGTLLETTVSFDHNRGCCAAEIVPIDAGTLHVVDGGADGA